jgi:MtfA peptidase
MLVLIACFAALVIGWLLAEPFYTEWRRKRIRARPFPAAWHRILERRVPYVRRMPRALRKRLEEQMQVFLAEKQFVGCDGVEITDEVRVTIAAQACLLILERKRFYFPSLHQILVYPSAFVIDRVVPTTNGLYAESSRVLSGESWTHGQVVLSWDDVVQGAAVPDDGANVVIHEFAHQLDQQKGRANGAPWLGSRHRYARWSLVMSGEYAQLQRQAAMGELSLFNYYGATDPAEFFAVASEVFFERPAAMAALHPALYEELRNLYGIDPASWPPV